MGVAGLAAGVGALATPPSDDTGTATSTSAGAAPADLDPGVSAALRERVERAREQEVSRSARRPPVASVQRETKAGLLPIAKQDVAHGVSEEVEPTDPRDIALSMLSEHGWSSDQFSCLDSLYTHESGWDPLAENPSSGAYGIPQSLPGDKMASYGDDWRTNPATQLAWGLAYIDERYGSPCGAWDFWTANNWY